MASVEHYMVEAMLRGCRPQDRSSMDELLLELDEDREMSITDRRNMRGHFVASAIVLNETNTCALVIEHNFLQRTLFPGGHIDPGEDPMVAAFREVWEETGVMARPLLSFPIDFDSHDIPANPLKNEGAHRHHDMLFVGQTSTTTRLREAEDEINNARWMTLDMLADLFDPRFYRVGCTLDRLKLSRYLSST